MDNQFKRGQPARHWEYDEFKTPEQAAAIDEDKTGTPIIAHHDTEKKKMSLINRIKKRKLPKLWPPNKWTYITAAVIILILAGGAYWLLSSHKTKPKPVIVSKP